MRFFTRKLICIYSIPSKDHKEQLCKISVSNRKVNFFGKNKNLIFTFFESLIMVLLKQISRKYQPPSPSWPNIKYMYTQNCFSLYSRGSAGFDSCKNKEVNNLMTHAPFCELCTGTAPLWPRTIRSSSPWKITATGIGILSLSGQKTNKMYK